MKRNSFLKITAALVTTPSLSFATGKKNKAGFTKGKDDGHFSTCWKNGEFFCDSCSIGS